MNQERDRLYRVDGSDPASPWQLWPPHEQGPEDQNWGTDDPCDIGNDDTRHEWNEKRLPSSASDGYLELWSRPTEAGFGWSTIPSRRLVKTIK